MHRQAAAERWRRGSLEYRIEFFDPVFAGRTEAAIAPLYPHLTAWPCDALVVSVGANPNGVIGGSGRIGQKWQIAEMIDGLGSYLPALARGFASFEREDFPARSPRWRRWRVKTNALAAAAHSTI